MRAAKPVIARRLPGDTFEDTCGDLWFVHAQRGWMRADQQSKHSLQVRIEALAIRYGVKSYVFNGRTFDRDRSGGYWGRKEKSL